MREIEAGLCPRFHAAVELIGRRWTGAVIRVLLDGRMRYSDLKAAVPDISDRMLSERLKELEAEGLVTRIVTPETPVRVEYELTEKGRALEGPLSALGEWAGTWIAAPSLEQTAAVEGDIQARRLAVKDPGQFDGRSG